MLVAFITQASFFKGTLFVFCFQGQLGHFGGTSFFIKGDHGEKGGQSALFTFGLQIFYFDDNYYFHRAVANIDYLRRADDQVADKDGQVEFHFVYPGGYHVGPCVAAGRGVSGGVHQLDYFTAVDVAGDVSLMRHHDFADDESAFGRYFFHSCNLPFYFKHGTGCYKPELLLRTVWKRSQGKRRAAVWAAAIIITFQPEARKQLKVKFLKIVLA